MIPDGLPLDAGVVGRAVRTCEPQLVVDVSADPDYFTVLPDVASEIALPLISEELGIVGVLDIETRSRLPADSLDVVRPLAAALTSAIDEIREGRTIDLSSLVRLFVHGHEPLCEGFRPRSEPNSPPFSRLTRQPRSTRRSRSPGNAKAHIQMHSQAL